MKLVNNPVVRLEITRDGNEPIVHTGRLLDILADHFDEGEHAGIRLVMFQSAWCRGSVLGVLWTIEEEPT